MATKSKKLREIFLDNSSGKIVPDGPDGGPGTDLEENDPNKLALKYIDPSEFDNPTLGTTPQREQIIQEMSQEIVDYRDDENFRWRKAFLFYTCFFSNFFGVTLSLYGLSLTVLFEQYDENIDVFYVSLIFYVPFLVWFAYVFLPGKKEADRRRRIHFARRKRRYYANLRHAHFHGHSEEDKDIYDREQRRLREIQSRNERIARGDRVSGTFSATVFGPSRKSGSNSSGGGGNFFSTNRSSKNMNYESGSGGRDSLRASVDLSQTPTKSAIKKTSVQIPVQLDKAGFEISGGNGRPGSSGPAAAAATASRPASAGRRVSITEPGQTTATIPGGGGVATGGGGGGGRRYNHHNHSINTAGKQQRASVTFQEKPTAAVAAGAVAKQKSGRSAYASSSSARR